MKKCPKCGTILDDSKKKCYMCGTELVDSKKNVRNFNNDIGASISRGQDNVFNNGEDIAFKDKDLVRKNNGNVFFSQNSNSQNTFGNEIDKLNSMSYDNRSNLKKGFDNIFSNKNFKSKDEINGKRVTYSTNPNIPKDMRRAMEASEKPKRKSKKNDAIENNNVETNVKTLKASSLRKEIEPEEKPIKKNFFSKKKDSSEEKNSNLFSSFPFLKDNNQDNANSNFSNNSNSNFMNNNQNSNTNNRNNTNSLFNHENSNSNQNKYDFGFVNNKRDSISQEEQKENKNKFQEVTKQLNKRVTYSKPKKVKGYKDYSYKGDTKQMVINIF